MNAQILITCWLHAAALEGLGAMNLLRWATAPSIREPVDILARHGRSDLARALAAQHAAAPEERSASWRTAEQSFTALYDPLVAQIFAADPKDPSLFSIEHWLRTGGTLFLIGEEDEGSSLAPIMAAFTRSILDTAKKVAAKMPNGRLDPPLGFFGDELANVAPLPQIPSLMSVSGSQNIFVVAVLQNLAQAQERWGEIGVRKNVRRCHSESYPGWRQRRAGTEDVQRASGRIRRGYRVPIGQWGQHVGLCIDPAPGGAGAG